MPARLPEACLKTIEQLQKVSLIFIEQMAVERHTPQVSSRVDLEVQVPAKQKSAASNATPKIAIILGVPSPKSRVHRVQGLQNICTRFSALVLVCTTDGLLRVPAYYHDSNCLEPLSGCCKVILGHKVDKFPHGSAESGILGLTSFEARVKQTICFDLMHRPDWIEHQLDTQASHIIA